MSQLVLPQQDRTIQFHSPLGDEVIATRFSGKEEISRLFGFQVEFLSTRSNVSPQEFIKKQVAVCIDRKVIGPKQPSKRYFHGVVNRFAYRGEIPFPSKPNYTLSKYRVQIVPWFWFLTRQTNCRIFQNLSVPEIVEKLLGEHGGDFRLDAIKGEYPQRGYCVQYRESDFHFVSRLLEEEGIYYYFKHEPHRHQMILGDHVIGYHACADDRVGFLSQSSAAAPNQIHSWEHEYEFLSGEVALDDFNFECPSLDLTARETTIMDFPGTKEYERYDYPGEYASVSEGQRYARLRMQEEEANHDTVNGEADCASFIPGGLFTLDAHPNNSEVNSERLITSVEHFATDSIDPSSNTNQDHATYRNSFRCMPAKSTFRPSRKTKRPFVRGAQTAIVTGPEDKIVHTDNYGRVKVQFHWDQDGVHNDDSSCWIRVSQDWAGSKYGSMYLPHIGQEVIIDFLEGNPDRPIITGRVYNGEQMPPVELPEKEFVSVVARDFYGNEIIVDGTADDEHILIRSPNNESVLQLGRDVGVVLETESNHDMLTLGNSFGVTIGTSTSVNVGVNTSVRVGLDLGLSVAQSFNASVSGAISVAFGYNYSYSRGNSISNGAKNCYNSCDVDHVINAGQKMSLSAGGFGAESTGRNSIVYLDGDGLELSHGARNSPMSESYSNKQLWKLFGATVLGGAAAGCAVGASALAKSSKNEKSLGGGLPLTAATAGALAAAAGIAHGNLGKMGGPTQGIWKKHETVRHKLPDGKDWPQMREGNHDIRLPASSMIKLNNDGIRLNCGKSNVLVSKDAKVNVTAEGMIAVESSDEIQLNAPLTQIPGKFKTANIEDVGRLLAPMQEMVDAQESQDGQDIADLFDG